VAVLCLNLLVMALLTVAVLGVYRGHLGFLVTTPILVAFAGLGLQLAVVAALAVLFSCFTNMTLAAIAGLALATAGHFTREALPYWRTSALGRVAALLVPNLSALDFKVAVVYSERLAAGPTALAFAAGLLYGTVVLALAAAAFARRDLH
jgi:hypothetical protein